MTDMEVIHYWDPAIDNICRVNMIINYKTWKKYSEELETLLGVQYYTDWTSYKSLEKPLPEKIRNILKQLAGPYGRVVFEVLKARRYA